MVYQRPPSPSDQQGFNRRWFAENLQRVYAPTDAEGVVAAWTDAITQLSIQPDQLQITCGRHCYENFVYNSATQVIIDVTGLKSFGVDDSYGVYVDVGMGNWDMYRLLNNVYGKTLPAGSCYSVGLGGHITGGGYGLFSKQWGLTIDLLTAVDVVVKTGGNPELIRASATENADLFWALKGGGGANFGIITRYYFGDAVPASKQMFTAAYTFEWSSFVGDGGAQRFADVISEFGQHCQATSVGPQPSFDILHLNHKATGNITWAAYYFDAPSQDQTGPDYAGFVAETFANKRKALSQIAPLSDQPGVINGHPWHGTSAGLMAEPDKEYRHYTFLEGIQNANGSGPNRFGKYKSAYMTSLFTDDMISALYAGLQTVPDGVDEADMANSLVQVDSYGGAINQVAPAATAIPQRSSIMKLQYQTYWDNASGVGRDDPCQSQAHLDWIDDMYKQIYAPWGGVPDGANSNGPAGVVDGCYFNYCDNDLGINGTPQIDRALGLYFGINLDRLLQVKASWNPENWFNGPQTLPVRRS